MTSSSIVRGTSQSGMIHSPLTYLWSFGSGSMWAATRWIKHVHTAIWAITIPQIDWDATPAPSTELIMTNFNTGFYRIIAMNLRRIDLSRFIQILITPIILNWAMALMFFFCKQAYNLLLNIESKTTIIIVNT